MIQAATPRIRNVALVGHSGVGKTTLAEALLLRAGAISRAGTVEDGTTVCDHEPEEIKRRMSLSPALAPFEWTASDGVTYLVNLVDTPGYADFAGGVDVALSVADLAVVLVSAVDGVEVGTEAVWRRCAEAGVPRLVFVTKEDKPRADFHRVLEQLRERFGDGFVVLELPIGEEEAFHGVADVLSDQAFEYDGDGTHRTGPVPDDVADEERRLHEQVAEEIVSGDDEQLERYLSGDVPTAAELGRTLAHEVRDCTEVPVLVGSATTGVGVDRLADLLCEVGPSPADRARRVVVGEGRGGGGGVGAGAAGAPGAGGRADDGAEVEVVPDPDGDVLVHVVRTVADPFVGQVSVFRVLSGTVRNDDHLICAATGTDERMHGMFRLRGKEHLPVDAVVAGDVAAVAKLAGSPTGALLSTRRTSVRIADGAPRPAPAYALALVPVSQSDDDKLSSALHRLVAEDPSLSVERIGGGAPSSGHVGTAQHVQTVLRGTGDVHLAVTIERLERKFGVHVTTEPVRVAYRETIAGPADAEGKLKKQSGGHGQFAVCRLRVAPRGRGEGVELVDSIVGGAIPRHYLPAVERGVHDALAAGGPLGYPVVDVRVEVYDGKYHSVDSSDMAFRTAAALGVKEALATAGTVLLEPVSKLVVTIPGELQGDVMGDLSARRGKISGSDLLADGRTVIEAMVPEAELARYVMDLRSLTGGRGEFTAEQDHYDAVPTHLVERRAATVG